MERLRQLGWNQRLDAELAGLGEALRPARVVVEHQDRFTVAEEGGELDAPLAGRLLAEAKRGDARPAVGDWVGLSEGDAVVHRFSRATALRRRAAGNRPVPQTVAANVDVVFVVTSCNREFRETRLERYLAAVFDSGATPVVVVNKADLAADPGEYVARVEAVAPGVAVVATSATEGAGLAELERFLGPGVTVALVGSSGVGKSTIGNWLLGDERLAVGAIRADDDKGRHTTTRRELVTLPGGRGVLIDTPGMRELALWLDPAALGRAFPEIAERAADCRFRNCRHEGDPGCAVRGHVSEARLQSFQRLRAELEAQAPRRR